MPLPMFYAMVCWASLKGEIIVINSNFTEVGNHRINSYFDEAIIVKIVLRLVDIMVVNLVMACSPHGMKLIPTNNTG